VSAEANCAVMERTLVDEAELRSDRGGIESLLLVLNVFAQDFNLFLRKAQR